MEAGAHPPGARARQRLRCADYLDAEHLLELLPDAKPVLHLHPAYDQFPDAHGALDREHDLELLFFGFVRPYKGLDLLIEALPLLPADLDVRLTVAGEFGTAPTRPSSASPSWGSPTRSSS